MRKYKIGDTFKSGRLTCEIVGHVPDIGDGIFRYRILWFDTKHYSNWTEEGLTTKMTPIKIQKRVEDHFEEDLFTI